MALLTEPTTTGRGLKASNPGVLGVHPRGDRLSCGLLTRRFSPASSRSGFERASKAWRSAICRGHDLIAFSSVARRYPVIAVVPTGSSDRTSPTPSSNNTSDDANEVADQRPQPVTPGAGRSLPLLHRAQQHLRKLATDIECLFGAELPARWITKPSLFRTEIGGAAEHLCSGVVAWLARSRCSRKRTCGYVAPFSRRANNPGRLGLGHHTRRLLDAAQPRHLDHPNQAPLFYIPTVDLPPTGGRTRLSGRFRPQTSSR